MEVVDEQLQRGRERYAAGDWLEACESLTRADGARPLEPDDLELLSTCEYMLGREERYVAALERAYRGHLDAEAPVRAARCAFWIGINLARSGEPGRAGGWLGRSQRLLDRVGGELVERGYLLFPGMFEREASGDLEGAASAARRAAEIGERFADPDLIALAIHSEGQMMVRRGEDERGIALLDEAMVAVTAGETSPIVTGLVYCGVILACREAYEVRRAAEWTEALSRWCERQPDLIAFTGTCRVHRAQIMELRGAWSEASEEAQRAEERSAAASNSASAGEAAYVRGNVHRLRGELAAAEELYRAASLNGREPQPGLALLRLAQARREAAAAAIRRALAETSEPGRRAALLPASVEIALSAGDVDGARTACSELEQIASGLGSAMLDAIAAGSRGAAELAAGDAQAALVALRRGSRAWSELEAPYEAARTRMLAGLACRALGDEDSATLELEAARRSFAELGAAPDLARVRSLTGGPDARGEHGLSDRELEVLRQVAAGRSNREIASELVISEHTVARHVQNIFAKLGVSSRTAAGAYAFRHGLA